MPRSCMRREELYLRDIVEAVDTIDAFLTGRSREDFAADELLRSAVLHKLTIIGEAAARLPRERRERQSGIPWPKIVGFRNVIVHVYFGVNWDIVWQAATVEAPALRSVVMGILNDEFSTRSDS